MKLQFDPKDFMAEKIEYKERFTTSCLRPTGATKRAGHKDIVQLLEKAGAKE
jgi:hypothetical protein